MLQILIADDHAMFRTRLRSLLESQANWRVCGEAADGREAVERAARLKPDVVLLDVVMPEMNGLDAARLIRRDAPDSHILIISQHERLEKEAFEAGAKAFIEKSRVSNDLIKAIHALSGAPAGAPGLSPVPGLMPKQPLDCLSGGGEMGALMRSLDWSRTAVGPVSGWPQSLRIAVRILLGSGYPMAIAWGPEFTFIYNDGYRPILGRTKHPALGKATREIFPEAWNFIGPLFERVLIQGEDTTLVNQIFFLDRKDYLEECYFTFSYSPIPNDEGTVGGVLVTVIETTDQFIEERRLHTLRDVASEIAKLRSEEEICEVAAGVFARNPKDLPFVVLYLRDPRERTARRMAACGIALESPLTPAVLPFDDSVWPLAEAAENSLPQVVALDGNRVALPASPWGEAPRQALVSPIVLPGTSEAAGFFIAGINPRKELDDPYRTFLSRIVGHLSAEISGARALAAERERAEALAALDRAKTAFFSNVSHEFRTPLTLMLGPLEDLLAKNAPNRDDHDQLALIHRNGLRLLKLVNTLLDFSRIEAGRMEAVYEPTDLALLTADLASIFRSAIEQSGLRLRVDCPALPEPVFVDRDMWEKIVLNLISNAFKFTLHGEIAVELRAAGPHVELAIRDTGSGIPAHELPRIFDRFHRVQNPQARTHEGSGIGLALVQELVKLHGGSIRVESIIGAGSAFTVSIPLGCAHLPAGRIQAPRSQVSTALGAEPYVGEALRWLSGDALVSPDPSGRPAGDMPELSEPLEVQSASARVAQRGTQTPASTPRILLADDNADMRDYVHRLLREHYDVSAVADGEAALHLARRSCPDLIVADVMMPRLDGFGLLREIRNDPALKGTPIILLSARAGEESRIEGLGAGADDYLVKPFSARELLSRVASHLAMARIRREAAELERELRAEAEADRSRIWQLFMQVPAAICLLAGPDHRYSFVNREYLRVTGRRSQDFIGKPIREALPEVVSQGFVDLLDRVYQTGVPYSGTETKVILNRAESPQEVYFNFAYQPIRDAHGKIEGILAHGVDVTQQVNARRAVELSEERIRLAQAAAHVGTWEWDPAGGSPSLSPELHRIFGTDPEDPRRTETWYSRLHPDEVPRVIELMKQGADAGEMEFEYRYNHPQLGLRWLFCKGRRLRDESRMFGVVLDVTERKQKDEALKQSEERFRAIVETTPECVKLVASDGTLLHMNAAGLAMIAAERAEMAVGKSVYGLIAPEDRDRFREFNQAICRGEKGSLEFDIIALNGRRRHMESHAAPLRRPDGSFVQLAVTSDITERTAANRATALLAAIVSSSDDAMISKDLDGFITSWKKGAERIFGYTAEEAIGRHITLVIPEDRHREETEILARLRRGERLEHFETIRKRRDGALINVSLTISPVRDDAGRIIGASKVARDITERKRAEERERQLVEETLAAKENYRILAESLDAEVRARTVELEKRNIEVLVQSEQLRDLSWRLLRTQDEERRRIARELHDSAGQILTALGMNLASAAKKAAENAPDAAARVQYSQKLVEQLTDEIRTMSYLLHPPLLDENGLAEALQWYVEGLKERSDLDIALDIPESFERLPSEIELVIFRVVQEALTNIHRHAQSKTAAIRLAQAGGEVSIEIQDRGKGIPPDKLAQIQAQGSGVGIRGMRERVRQFKGDMKIESDGQGTRISVVFPIVKSAGEPEPVPAARDSAARAGASALRILIADDSAMVRRGIADLISDEARWQVCGEAASGRKTLELAGKLQPDVVLLDINLPDSNGLEIANRLRREVPAARVVIMSQHDTSRLLPAAMQAGAIACLDKGKIGSELLSSLKTMERSPGLPRSGTGPNGAAAEPPAQ